MDAVIGAGDEEKRPAMASSGDAAESRQPEKAHRRRWSKEYKRRILEEAEDLEPGQLGALLRREGLYKSHLTEWRRRRALGRLDVKPPRDVVDRLMELERENRRLRRRLTQAEMVIAVQKKLSAILGLADENGKSE